MTIVEGISALVSKFLVLSPLFVMVFVFVGLFLFLFTKMQKTTSEKFIQKRIDQYITTLEERITRLERELECAKCENHRMRKLLADKNIEYIAKS